MKLVMNMGSDNTVDVIGPYIDTIRALVNSQPPTREALRLNKDGDFGFICACMDLLGDTDTALHDFRRWHLAGPTRYEDNHGERYLRMYGLLTATYLQQNAAKSMCALFQLEEQ